MATATSNLASYDENDCSYEGIADVENAYTATNSRNYGRVTLTYGANAVSYVYWYFNIPTIPEDATIDSVVCNYKIRLSDATAARVAIAVVQMCSGKILKGTEQSFRTTAAAVVGMTDTGSWTPAEVNAGIGIRTYAVRGTSRTTTQYYIYCYGADVTITYTEAITGNTIYIKSNGVWVEANDVLVKNNSSWQSVGEVYKKNNGSWILQDDKSCVFDPDKIYTKSN